MGVQITAYSVCTWGNKNKPDDQLWYGVKVRVKGQGWMHCTDGGGPLLYSTRANAQDSIRKMKAERDKRGFKKPIRKH